MDQEALLITAALAVSSHLHYRRREPHPVTFLRNTCLLEVGFFLVFRTLGHGTLSALRLSLVQLSVYLFALGLSIGIYRATPLHPLSHLPGPFLAKLSQLWFFREAYRGQTRQALRKLHNRYGDIVRIGPNEISINNVEALQPIHGSKGGGWEKGWAYQLTIFDPHETNTSLLALGKHHLHAARRKLWDRAFNTTALQTYQADIVKHVSDLREKLTSLATSLPSSPSEGSITDLNFWISAMVIDIMSSFAFSEGRDLVVNGKDVDGVLGKLDRFARPFGLIRFLPWIKPFMFNRYLGSGVAIWFREFAKNSYIQRRKRGTETLANGEVEKTDVFYWLLGENLSEEETEKGGVLKLSEAQLASDSNLVIGAGSDTSRTTLTTLFYYLMKAPTLYQKLQSELDALPSDLSASDFPALSKLPFLNACIDECLRLEPPVSSGAQRVSPQGGATICDTFIPEATTARIPAYVLQRDPRYFSDPDSFDPDRWLPGSTQKLHDKRAFFPFLIGPYGCIGKQVALLEMRFAVATIVKTFDLELVGGGTTDGSEWIDNMEDTFLCEIQGPLKSRVKLRKS